jgi:predicted dienelactone hydrolase
MDHPGDRFGDSSQVGRFAAWRRPADVRFALDRVLADPTLGPRLDRTRIAGAGHSSGAYTMLALAGARLRPQAYLSYCGSPARGPDCKLFDDLDPSHIPDLADAGKSWRDSRIRAVVALSPVLGPGIDAASLRTVAVPVTIFASPTDSVVPFDRNAARYGRFIRGARIVKVPKADHFVFMPLCTLAGRLVASQVCVDAQGVDRRVIHDHVVAQTIQLFDRRLGVRTAAPKRRGARENP